MHNPRLTVKLPQCKKNVFSSQQCYPAKLAYAFNWEDYYFDTMEFKFFMITRIFQTRMTRFSLIAFLWNMFHRTDNTEMCKKCHLSQSCITKGSETIIDLWSLSNLATAELHWFCSRKIVLSCLEKVLTPLMKTRLQHVIKSQENTLWSVY